MATEMYHTWNQITEKRESQKFSSTSVVLKVHPQKIENDTEYIFNLSSQHPSDKKTDGFSLPGSEASRRSSIQKLKAFCRLYINDKKVSETKKYPVAWPSFEV
jgi:hypothetical protein